jgi:hypothetical protein
MRMEFQTTEFTEEVFLNDPAPVPKTTVWKERG